MRPRRLRSAGDNASATTPPGVWTVPQSAMADAAEPYATSAILAPTEWCAVAIERVRDDGPQQITVCVSVLGGCRTRCGSGRLYGAEWLIPRNEQAKGSSPFSGSTRRNAR